MTLPSAVVFDLDDTLYLEREYIQSGFRQVGEFVRKKFAVDTFSDCAWKLFVQGKRGKIFDSALNSLELPTSTTLVHELVSIYRRHDPTISLPDDASQCIKRLHGTCRLGLITDGPVISQENKIRALSLEKWIPLAILTGKWRQDFSKPHPRAFIDLQRRMGIRSDQCMYVGDNPIKDFISPQQMGWKTVRLRRAGGLHSQEPGNSPVDYEFTDLYPLIDLFASQMQSAG